MCLRNKFSLKRVQYVDAQKKKNRKKKKKTFSLKLFGTRATLQNILKNYRVQLINTS